MNTTDPLKRPGVARETVIAAGIRHVEAEDANSLVGFEVAGLVIPYWSIGGHPLEVAGKHFHRLRVADPKGAKYLSPKNSGAQLYIPRSYHAQPTLVLTEGEFKALALCEAGFFAVGLGGITSALHGGKLLPLLTDILAKKSVATVAFLGDADTALNYDFSREAVKIRAALPAGVRLVLPRVPFTGPKGIDDSREALGEDFTNFMDGILEAATEVTPTISAGALAVRLLTPWMADVAADYDNLEGRLLRLAKCLDAGSLDRLAKLVKEHAGLSVTAFRKSVSDSGHGDDAGSDDAELPAMFFDGERYFRRAISGKSFEAIIRADAFLELRNRGFSQREPDDGGLSPLEGAVHRIQTTNRVQYAGPLCGRPAGLHVEGDVQILATTGPAILPAIEGDPEALGAFLAGLFGCGHDPHFETQLLTFMGWMKHFRVALRKHDQHLPGQALALVGERDCGKSLLQSLITIMAGGRSADASLCLLGKSDFNSELWRAEHLTLDDDKLGESDKESHAVRDRLKKLVPAKTYNLHAKNRDAVPFRPIWRTSISANLDDESINVLPAPDDSFGDKIIYLRCYPPAVPFTDGSDEARAIFWNGLTNAIPAFLHVVDCFEPKDEMRGSRFFIREFHHPDVLEAIFSNAGESPLGELIDEWITDTGEVQDAPAATILASLITWAGESRVRMFTKSARHFGFQLGRLSRLPGFRDRIVKHVVRVGGRVRNEPVNFWQITPKTHVRSNADL